MSLNKDNQSKFSIFTLLLTFLAFSFSQQMQMTTLPLYTHSLNYSGAVAGTLTSIFTISALIGRPLSGYLLNRWKSKVIVLLGLVLFFLATSAYLLSSELYFIYVLRMFQGIGFSLYSTAILTQLTLFNNEEYSIRKRIGLFGVITSIAQALAPGLGMMLVDWFGFNVMFLVIILFCFVAIMGTLLLPNDSAHVALAQLTTHKKKKIRPQIYWIALLMFGVSVAQSSVMSFLPLHAKTMSVPDISLYYLVSAISLIISRLVGTSIIKKEQSKIPYYIGLSFLIVVYALIAVGTSIHFYILAGIFYGFGYGLLQPSVNLGMLRCVPENNRGFANAFYYCSIDLGYGLGSLVWGMFVMPSGYQQIFYRASILMSVVLTCYILYMILYRNIKPNIMLLNWILKLNKKSKRK